MLKMKMAIPNKRVLAMLAILVPLVALLAYVALSSGPLAKIPVNTATVAKRQIAPSLFGTGTIEALYNYKIGPTAAGRLKTVNVQVGETVRAGQILGEIDPVDLDERIASLNAALLRVESAIRLAEVQIREATLRKSYAEGEATRYKQLVAADAASVEAQAGKQLAGETAETGLLAALASRDAALHDLARTRFDRDAIIRQRANLLLKAPARGLVVARNADPGATVAAGQAVVEMIEPGSVWINARFDQISTGGLRPGLTAKITLRSQSGQIFGGKISRIEPLADSVTEETLAKILFDAIPKKLPSLGEIAEITVSLPALPPGPAVPNAALHRVDGRLGVWQISGKSLRFTPVKTGAADLDGFVRIEEGLKVGDTIVLHSPRSLNVRSRIRVVEKLPGVNS
jgi:RND family efflux transporter MFP subunit